MFKRIDSTIDANEYFKLNSLRKINPIETKYHKFFSEAECSLFDNKILLGDLFD